MEYESLWELVLVCVGVAVRRTMYQRKVDVDMLNAVKSILCSDEGLTLETSANTLFTAFSISTSTLPWFIVRLFLIVLILNLILVLNSCKRESFGDMRQFVIIPECYKVQWTDTPNSFVSCFVFLSLSVCWFVCLSVCPSVCFTPKIVEWSSTLNDFVSCLTVCFTPHQYPVRQFVFTY